MGSVNTPLLLGINHHPPIQVRWGVFFVLCGQEFPESRTGTIQGRNGRVRTQVLIVPIDLDKFLEKFLLAKCYFYSFQRFLKSM